MNILLYVGPRSASKGVQRNLIEYIKSLGQEVYPFHDLYNSLIEDRNLQNKEEKYNHLIIENNEVIVTDELWPKDIELDHRTYNIIPILPKKIVMKMIPFDLVDQSFTNRKNFCFDYFDKVYIVKRQDAFNQAMSFALCQKSNRWDWSPEQDFYATSSEDFTTSLVNHPIKIDEDVFLKFYKFIKKYDETDFLENEKIKVINVPEMLSLQTSKDFTEHFSLEYRDFNFLGFKKELLDKKQFVISNYEKLIEISQNI